MEVADLLGYSVAAASLVAFSARTMIPLRVAAIVSNVLFTSSGIAGGPRPPVLHGTMTLGMPKRSLRRPENAGREEKQP